MKKQEKDKFESKVYLTLSAYYDYEKIMSRKIKEGIQQILKRLEKDPYRYEALSGPLSEFYLIENYLFRIVYQIVSNRVLVHTIRERAQHWLGMRPVRDGTLDENSSTVIHNPTRLSAA